MTSHARPRRCWYKWSFVASHYQYSFVKGQNSNIAMLLLEILQPVTRLTAWCQALPCLALRSYVLDGTRTKLRFCLHIFAHPDSRRGVSRKSLFVIVEPHSNIQKMSLEKVVTRFIWFMHIDGKNEQNILFLKMIQIRTYNTRSQSIADPRESGGAAK